jgi:hypothetical protein
LKAKLSSLLDRAYTQLDGTPVLNYREVLTEIESIANNAKGKAAKLEGKFAALDPNSLRSSAYRFLQETENASKRLMEATKTHKWDSNFTYYLTLLAAFGGIFINLASIWQD